MQKIHLIAIGGSAMHNMALALHTKGHIITGSDDEIYEPSKSRLEKVGLLPKELGWFPEKNIHNNLDAVILGMHAKADNPELLKAKALQIPIYSYPEYVYQQSLNKQRIVIAGSHGKTTITSMILHALKANNKKFDYLVGAQIEGFETMVSLTDAPIIVIEGDEYLASPIHKTSKFHAYNHHMLVVSGVAWDHINVFPTWDEYKKTFETLIKNTPKGGIWIYNEDDKFLTQVAKNLQREDMHKVPYTELKSKIKAEQTIVSFEDSSYVMSVFGTHNMYNLSAAKEVCTRIGISEFDFFTAMQSFKGAANRLQKLAESKDTVVYKDFAHAPSKVLATTKAVEKQYPKRDLVAILELHTFSSLNKNFLSQYADTMDAPDVAIVYLNPHTLANKNLPPISEDDIRKAFKRSKMIVFYEFKDVVKTLKSIPMKEKVVLFMSSGNFDGADLNELSNEILA